MSHQNVAYDLRFCRADHILIHMDDVRINKAIGDELRAARARRDWTREELVRRSGVSIASIRRYENGARSVPVDVLYRLLIELGITIDDIDRAIRRASADDSERTTGSDLDATFLATVGELDTDGANNDGQQVV